MHYNDLPSHEREKITQGLGIDVSAFFVFTKQEKKAWKQMLLEISEDE